MESSVDPKTLKYLAGFGNHFETEVIEGTVPQGRNSPQKCPHGLYAEQLSGTPFTYNRARNERSWLYRIYPTAVHSPFEAIPEDQYSNFISNFEGEDKRLHVNPAQMRWLPMKFPADGQKVNFL
mmetsp:Transcript_38527/g.36899  ORF Transcript_38527/g.36899 Transcript_38527/m.36899 type:complete len:124 (-) Transcript_38527:1006-1377(-)